MLHAIAHKGRAGIFIAALAGLILALADPAAAQQITGTPG